MPDQELLLRARELAVSRIGAFLARGLDGLPAELEALQAASTSPGEKKLLAQTIVQVRPCQAAIERAFAEGLRTVCARKTSGVAPRDDAELSLDALTLVDDSAIEVEIALGRLVRKTVDEIDAEQYYGIEARIGEVAAGRLVEGSSNPLGVESALEALKLACDAVPEDAPVRMALVNALQPHVAAGLRHAYREINEQLAAAGVQPRLHYTVQRAADVGTGKDAPQIPSGMMVSQALNLRDLLPVSTGSLVDIRTVVGAMLAGPPEGRRSGARVLSNRKGMLYSAAVATPIDPVLVAGLREQQGVASGEGGVAALRDLAPAAAHPLDQLTGDLMANVFEFMGADQALPEAVRDEVARLPVAAFRAAMLDRTFFASAEHPLRQFLEEVGRLAADPETDVAPGGAFVTELRGVVDGLVQDFDRDLAVFGTAGARLRSQAEAAAAAAQQRLADELAALEKKERLEVARAQAAALIGMRVGDDTPPFLARFLREVWPDAVAAAEAAGRTGDDGAERRLAVVDDLLWSVTAKQSGEVPRLVALLPRLVPALQRGMADAGFADAPRQAFLDELMRSHAALLQSARSARSSALPPSPAPAPAPARPKSDAALPYPAGNSPAGTVVPPAALPRGTVVEFRDGAAPQRAKLTWISPQRTTYVFTSSQSGARSLSGTALSEALASGAVSVVQGEPTAVERALAAVAR